METFLTVVLFVAACTWTWVGVVGYWGVRKWKKVSPTYAQGEPTPKETPGVVVLVPARNEAQYIETTLRAILAQDYPNFTIRLIDDQSTDDTLNIARRIAKETNRLEVVSGIDRPSGWAGKPWALHQVTRGLTAAWYLFVDADIVLHPQAFSRAMETVQTHRADMLSLLIQAELKTFWQRTVSMAFIPIGVLTAPLVYVNDPKKKAAMAMGGFMLLSREAYEAVGGHEAVKNEIIEDGALASKVKAAGLRLLVLPAPDLLKTHYFGAFSDIWGGIRKHMYAFWGRRIDRLICFTLLFSACAFFPWIGLILSLFHTADPPPNLWPWVFLLALISAFCMLVISGSAARMTHSSLLYMLSFPIGVAVVLCAAWSSAWAYHFGPGVEWKSRTVASKNTSDE